MLDLTPRQLLTISNLSSSEGYSLLLGELQKQIQASADVIFNAETDETERRAVAVWRAKLEVLRWLMTLPDACNIDLQSIPENYEGLSIIDKMRSDNQANW